MNEPKKTLSQAEIERLYAAVMEEDELTPFTEEQLAGYEDQIRKYRARPARPAVLSFPDAWPRLGMVRPPQRAAAAGAGAALDRPTVEEMVLFDRDAGFYRIVAPQSATELGLLGIEAVDEAGNGLGLVVVPCRPEPYLGQDCWVGTATVGDLFPGQPPAAGEPQPQFRVYALADEQLAEALDNNPALLSELRRRINGDRGMRRRLEEALQRLGRSEP